MLLNTFQEFPLEVLYFRPWIRIPSRIFSFFVNQALESNQVKIRILRLNIEVLGFLPWIQIRIRSCSPLVTPDPDWNRIKSGNVSPLLCRVRPRQQAAVPPLPPRVVRLPQGGVSGQEVPGPGDGQRPLQAPQEEARQDHSLHQDRQVGH